MDWSAVTRLIAAFQPVSEMEREKLLQILNRSSALLTPFNDPLLIDLGAHRWLAGAREETYSDWLAWILEQLPSPSAIYAVLLGRRVEASESKCIGRLTVNREYSLVDEEGMRRTDLELLYNSEDTILVEVKKGDADTVNTEQLKTQYKVKQAFRHHIILAAQGSKQYYEGFELRTWASVCIALRQIVTRPPLRGTIQSAMILAFVGAVEQNILLLLGDVEDKYKRKQLISSLARKRIEEHLGKVSRNE